MAFIQTLPKLLVSSLLLFTATAFAAVPKTRTIAGTVVHVSNAQSTKFVVSDTNGQLVSFHARRAPRIGRIVRATGRKLRNGSYATTNIRALGRSRRAKLVGTVTAVDQTTRTYTLSARGVSMSVSEPPSNDLPGVGERLKVRVSVSSEGDITEVSSRELGADTNGIELEGIILAVDTANRTISLSRDDDLDDDDNGQQEDANLETPLLVHVPETFDISAYVIGQRIEAVVSLNGDGSFTLISTESDDSREDADEEDAGDQGEDQNEHGGEAPENHDG